MGDERAVRWDDLVLVGRIARPHGLRGHVVVNPETDFADTRFVPDAVFWTRMGGETRQVIVREARMQGARPVVRFEEASRIEDAERLVGLDLRVEETALRPLDDGVYYQHQLVGCAVETVEGLPVGEVARVTGGPSGSLLGIDGPNGEILIPLADDICVAVDVTGKRITVRPPDGLLELNERPAARRPVAETP